MLSAGEKYERSFSRTLSGQEGDTHRNIALAVVRDAQRQIALGADKWEIDFVANPAILTLSSVGFALFAIFLSVWAVWFIGKKKGC